MRLSRALAVEAVGALIAAALAVVSVLRLTATSGRGELLLRDADSFVVAMLARSVTSGEPLDWAMSPVLFVPETALYGTVGALGWSPRAVLLACAVLTLVLLYAALRLVAARAGMLPALAAFTAFTLLVALEGAGDRESLELASLLTLTTYYSATVIAAVVTLGLVRRALDRGLRPLTAVGLAAIGALSTLTNPLFLAWSSAPLVLVLLVVALRSPDARDTALKLVAAIGAGAAVGLLARIPVSPLIVADGAHYAKPAAWLESAGYYLALLGERMSRPEGVAAAAITVTLLAVGVMQTVRAGRRRDPATVVVAAYAWVAPLVALVGLVAAGTVAARYLQPWAFAPVIVVTTLSITPARLRVPSRSRRTLLAASAVLATVALALAVPPLARAATAVDTSLACVTAWVDGTPEHGAGQYWSIRAPKTAAQQPERLLQVDTRLTPYTWLVNRADFDTDAVRYLITDAQSAPFELPAGTPPPAQTVSCGRYTILDWGAEVLPIG